MNYLERHTAFSRILNNDLMNKVDIDPRLIENFKRVLIKIQKHFNEHGYNHVIDYTKLLDDYLLSDSKLKLKIEISDEPRKHGWVGLYNFKKNKIIIDDSILDNQDKLEHTLCHEFIHFLVNKGKSIEERKGIFIDEALTEMLTTKIDNVSFGNYEPQVKMLSFANILQNKKNDFSIFLQGGIDAKRSSPFWETFLFCSSVYQDTYSEYSQNIYEAREDHYYQLSQKALIKMMGYQYSISSFEDFEEIVRKLSLRPVVDEEWMDSYYKELYNKILNVLEIDENNKKVLLEKMMDFRKVSEELVNLSQEYVVIADYNNMKIPFIKKGYSFIIPSNVDINISYVMEDNDNYIFVTKDEKIKINKKVFDYKRINEERRLRRQELLERQEELASSFREIKKGDFNQLEKVVNNEGLLKLERFELPLIDEKAKSSSVYIAVYEDKIELLGYNIIQGQTHNIKLNDYIGRLEDKTVAFKPLDTRDDAIICSNVNSTDIRKKIIKYIATIFGSNLSNEQVELLIDIYKKNTYVDEEDTNEEIREDAIKYYAKDILDQLSEEERVKITKKVIEDTSNIYITVKDGVVDVSIPYKDDYAVVGKRTVLYDKNGKAPLNEFVSIIKDRDNKRKQSKSVSMKLDERGNLVVDLDKKIEFFKSEYEKTTHQIEELISQNAQEVVDHYQGRLSFLHEKRDMLNKQVALLFEDENKEEVKIL